MNQQRSGKIIGIGFLALALIGGVTAWTIGQQPVNSANPAGKPAVKAGEKPEVKAAEKEEGDETEIKLADAPKAVRDAVAKITAADKVTKVIKESDEGITVYEVEYKADGVECSADFSATGEVLELEKSIKEADLPAAALAALKKEFPKATFRETVAVQKFFYEVVVVTEGNKRGVKVNAAGDIEDGEKDEAGKGEEDEKHEGKKEGK